MYEAIFGALERAIGSDDIWIYKRVSTQDFHRVSISFYIYISSLLCIEGPHIYGVYTKFILGLEYGRGSCKSSRSNHSCGKGRREELCFFSQCSLSYIIPSGSQVLGFMGLLHSSLTETRFPDREPGFLTILA